MNRNGPDFTEEWTCNSCKWVGDVGLIVKKIVFYATREEPDEFLFHCPECDKTDLEEVEQILCRTCDDELVKDEGEQCSECRTVNLERQHDELMGH